MIHLAWLRQLASPRTSPWPPLLPLLLHISALTLLPLLATSAHGMTDDTIASLRQDARNLFYHGYTSYLTHAFPEDELAPLACAPLTRNRENPADIGLNDVLGNYSLTLIDSLSTLAILASGEEDGRDGHFALRDFQEGVGALVDLYGDGKSGSCGSRACGFDLDSKVQVFETNIRGVGGLLSAHLFAVGELPVRGYEPEWVDVGGGARGIRWPEGFVYTEQLLDLALDLATRLLPAFNTASSLPYPRVNLRYGIPFYQDAEDGVCRLDGTSSDPREITETCAAGAGSLVLEFTVLSRLIGDDRFEQLAKDAFWSVWDRRSAIGLIGNGLDAESGQWTIPPLAGIGAGIDSFYEYAFKSHILLSSASDSTDSDAFLDAWEKSHAAINRHIKRSSLTEKHPYYGQSDLTTGAPRYSWIDNLSAYYPGLLTLAGELDEAIESHLLFSALWTRYSALPERWHAPGNLPQAAGGILDPNFKHWAGRPEFIESTYYLYLATRDPWLLHVGEMVLRDVRRRCWTQCGWTALSDVVTGEQKDRMESFFLGETAKYLFLLFSAAEAGHELDRLRDAAWVFSTEGHPLVIPKRFRAAPGPRSEASAVEEEVAELRHGPAPMCPAPAPSLPLTASNIANRADLFHASALAQLHLVPINPARSSPLLEASTSSPGISYADIRSPTNYTFYPWTLPPSLIPHKGLSSPVANPLVSTLTFPDLTSKHGAEHPSSDGSGGKPLFAFGALQKVLDGVLINSLSNIRFNMVQIPRHHTSAGLVADRDAVALNRGPKGPALEYRIQSIANWALGRDEKVLISADAMKAISPSDPNFTRLKDLERVDLVLDVPDIAEEGSRRVENVLEVGGGEGGGNLSAGLAGLDGVLGDLEAMVVGLLEGAGIGVKGGGGGSAGKDDAYQEKETRTAGQSAAAATQHSEQQPTLTRHLLPAILPTGIGAAPLPAIMDALDPLPLPLGTLSFHKIYFLDSTLCSHALPSHIPTTHSILIIRRGGCSFNDKLANIPPFIPDSSATTTAGESLKLVIVLSYPEDTSQEQLIRPLLDSVQRTPAGLERRFPLAMCLVDGSAGTEEVLRRAAGRVGWFDGEGVLVEEEGEIAGAGAGGGKGLAVKRRYWFESMGVPIGNLIML